MTNEPSELRKLTADLALWKNCAETRGQNLDHLRQQFADETLRLSKLVTALRKLHTEAIWSDELHDHVVVAGDIELIVDIACGPFWKDLT